MPIPTRRLAVVAALASLVVLLAPAPRSALLVVNLVLVGAALADWAVAVRPARLTVSRDAPGVVVLGGGGEITWRVTNPTGRTLRVALADELAPSLGATDRRTRIRVGGRRSVAASTTVRPHRRGRYTPREIVVRVEGPLGLAARQAPLPVPGVVRVYPPFRSRAEAELRIERARLLAVGLRSTRGRGGGTDFDSLRDYSPDDEFRRIDWSATARSTRAIVRTYRAERNQTVLVLLDAGRIMAGQVGDAASSARDAGRAVPPAQGATRAPRLDHAMDAVMMLTAVGTRLGDRVGLVAFDDEVRAVVPPGHGRAQLGRVTEAMYDLEARLVESDYRGAFLAALTRFRRRSLLVLLSDLAEEAVAETLLPALPLVARRHLVIVASVTDPEVAGWAAALPDDATAAYRKAAAVSALAARARTAARLRALGATVIDAEPGRLSALLADAYVDIKAQGRL